jgi:Domain of unknown function (DUF4286)
MLLYTVTVSINKTIEADWVKWMKDIHIPNVLNTGLFSGHQFYKVLSHDDPTTCSFCAMYYVPVLDNFEKYLNDFAPALRQEVDQKFGGQYAAFRTLLEEVV